MDTGLFNVMISLGQPKTCQEIADAGKYKERYVINVFSFLVFFKDDFLTLTL